MKRVVVIALTGALAGAMLVPGPARAEGWTAPVTLSAPGTVSYAPAVSQAADGTAVAAWYDVGATGQVSSLQVVQRPPGGQWTPIASVGSDIRSDPVRLVAVPGGAVLAWTEGTSRIRVAEARAGQAPTVREVTSDGELLDIAADSEGNLSLLYVSRYRSQRTLDLLQRSSAGVWSEPSQVTDLRGGFAYSAELVQRAGTTAVAAVTRRDASNELELSVFTPVDGGWRSQQVDRRPTQTEFEYALDIDSQRRVHLAWAIRDYASPAHAVLTPSGWDQRTYLDPGTRSSSVADLTLAVADSGATTVGWTARGAAGTSVVTAVRTSGGAWQPAAVLTGSGTGATLVDLVGNAAGRTAAVWFSSASRSLTPHVSTRSGDGAWSQPTTLSTPTSAPQADVSVDRAGDVLTAWCLADAGGTTAAIGSRVLDSAPPVVGALRVPATGRLRQALAMEAPVSDTWSAHSVTWAFGDGSGAEGSSVTHAYPRPGTYTVTVTATDALGNSTSTSSTVAVTAVHPRVSLKARKKVRVKGSRRLPVTVTTNDTGTVKLVLKAKGKRGKAHRSVTRARVVAGSKVVKLALVRRTKGGKVRFKPGRYVLVATYRAADGKARATRTIRLVR